MGYWSVSRESDARLEAPAAMPLSSSTASVKKADESGESAPDSG